MYKKKEQYLIDIILTYFINLFIIGIFLIIKQLKNEHKYIINVTNGIIHNALYIIMLTFFFNIIKNKTCSKYIPKDKLDTPKIILLLNIFSFVIINKNIVNEAIIINILLYHKNESYTLLFLIEYT